MKTIKVRKYAYLSFAANFIYAVGNCVIGLTSPSWWFITVGAYYTVLSVIRFYLLKSLRNHKKNPDTELFVTRFTGILLIALSFCLVGVNTLSAIKERGVAFDTVIMIGIATYSFTKITIAIIRMLKLKNTASPITKALQNISFADAVVSIYTLQRSMLVTFPGMNSEEIKLFNILTGTVVYLIILLLGINLIEGKHVKMAKSKIAKANKKIAEKVTDGYKKIEKGVVGGYKKVEQGTVKGYTKIEDKFIEAYLTKEGETVEEAKARLKNKNS